MARPCGCQQTMGRYSPDGVWQTSTDGGCTWVDNPGCDPTQNQTTFPPLPGDDGLVKRCIAATAAVAFLKQQTDAITADTGAWASITAIHDALRDQLLKSLGWAEGAIAAADPILWAWAIALFVIGATALQAALTTDVWTRLKCNFYCNLENDAQFDDADVAEVLTRLGDDETGLAYTYLSTLVDLYGALGLTNAARSNSTVEADCSDCTCGGDCGVAFPVVFCGTLVSADPDTGTFVITSAPNCGGHSDMISFNMNEAGTQCCCINQFDHVGGLTEFWQDCDLGNHNGPPTGHCARFVALYHDGGNFNFNLTVQIQACANPGASDCFE